ncbi:hypothetical protein HK405_014404, partial [Cladochytrium tenue]
MPLSPPQQQDQQQQQDLTKAERAAHKALLATGLRPLPTVTRVVLRRRDGSLLIVAAPHVFATPQAAARSSASATASGAPSSGDIRDSRDAPCEAGSVADGDEPSAGGDLEEVEDTYIVLGAVTVNDGNPAAQASARAAFARAEAAESAGVRDDDLDLVLRLAGATEAAAAADGAAALDPVAAARILRANGGDVVQTVLDLT